MKPRANYFDHFGGLKPITPELLTALVDETTAEAAVEPPMVLTTKSADAAATPLSAEELGDRVVAAVRGFVARKTAALEARLAALEAQRAET